MRAQASKTNRSVKLSESGMSVMRANSTRLELVIVAAALLVLLFCSRPPRSGNAEVRPPRTEMPVQIPPSQEASVPVVSDAMESSMQGGVGAAEEIPPVDVRPRTKRVGIVDARNSGNPKYKDLMYGEVTVRWIWNGAKFVPQKVCIVDEGNGVTSTWSFDQKNGVTITERQEPVDTPQ
jgi:hypothetical protein